MVDPTPVDNGYNPIERHYVQQEDDPYFQLLEVEGNEGGADGDVEAEFEGDTNDEDDDMDRIPVVGPPFPGGPNNLSVLNKYTKHVAVPLWFNAFVVSFLLFKLFN